ncbi:hypothetical protein EN974_20550 [Mesorhizobium sp. M7A.F.Ca.CA.001.12.2.1]|nr:hypothetical protein EN974_20550 [Mesorhizobium sp. M7A.F.Ca.CA.001.12.2.1]RUZ23808.1 hypothetical protein EN949_17135 [Mesorhizobium sp. M7A.F.Ca.US.007.01.2.1]RUZ41462.1 hypothetical protein EN948_29065 [Mesorhizobium sp. M7A.F.Ca.US.003.02.1.1]RUZ61911.1 hypothetical protein EN950_17810 [Mesorhizobium sp. M7A.F.Ca.US.007.01.1.1]RUZ82898.1 hypothetical protein EN947_16850 [Mesorhizobium sp. M7A.F.Ca.US.003.02.2.1]
MASRTSPRSKAASSRSCTRPRSRTDFTRPKGIIRRRRCELLQHKRERQAAPSVLPDPALRCRSGRSSFGKPSNWLSVRCADHSSPPARGAIALSLSV